MFVALTDIIKYIPTKYNKITEELEKYYATTDYKVYIEFNDSKKKLFVYVIDGNHNFWKVKKNFLKIKNLDNRDNNSTYLLKTNYLISDQCESFISVVRHIIRNNINIELDDCEETKVVQELDFMEKKNLKCSPKTLYLCWKYYINKRKLINKMKIYFQLGKKAYNIHFNFN